MNMIFRNFWVYKLKVNSWMGQLNIEGYSFNLNAQDGAGWGRWGNGAGSKTSR